MIAEWFILCNGGAVGPYTSAQIIELVQQGSLQATSFVRRLDGPPLSVIEALSQMASAGSRNTIVDEPVGDSGSFSVGRNLERSPTSVTRLPRRKKSSLQNLLITLAAIAVGGVAATYAAKGFLGLVAPQPVEAPPKDAEIAEVKIAAPPRREPRPVTRPSNIGQGNEENLATSRPSAPILPPVRRPFPIDTSKPTLAPPRAMPSSTAPPLPSPPAAAKLDEATTAWLNALDSIHARRDSLMLKIAAVVQKGSPLEDQAKTIDAECRPKEKAISDLKQGNTNLLSRIELLRSQNIASNSTSNNSEISQLQDQVRTNYSTIGTLNTAARRTEYRKVMGEIATLKEEYLGLLREADNLRAELVFHLNPFSTVPEQIAKEGLKYFGRPITGNNAIPNSDAVFKAWNEFGMACIYLRKGDDANAEKYLNAAMTSEPQEMTFRAILGYWKLRRDQNDEALTEIVAALKATPENWTINFVMALFQLRKGAPRAAEQFLRTCRDLDKTNQRGLTLLSLVKSTSSDEKIRNVKFAKQFADEALKLSKSAASHLATAAAHAEAGEFPDAVKHAQSAVALREANRDDDLYLRSMDALNKSNAIRIDWPTFDAWNQL